MHFLQVVIRNAKELYEFAESTMKNPARSRYQSESVKVKRCIFLRRQYTAQQKRSVFQRSEGKQIHPCSRVNRRGLYYQYEALSCYCDACLDFQYDHCENSLYVDNWKEQELEREYGYQPSAVTRGDVSDALEGIKQLATEGVQLLQLLLQIEVRIIIFYK